MTAMSLIDDDDQILLFKYMSLKNYNQIIETKYDMAMMANSHLLLLAQVILSNPCNS